MTNELTDIVWWSSLQHEGLLLDITRLGELYAQSHRELSFYVMDTLRIQKMAFENDSHKQSDFIKFVLEKVCNFTDKDGHWNRAIAVKPEWGCTNWGTTDITKPDWLYFQNNTPVLPIFIDRENARLGIGRSRNLISKILHWMRNFKIKLALLTNGRQWRIVYAGMDNEAFSEWEIDQWLAGGQASPELNGFVALVSPILWQHADGEDSLLLNAVNASRKGQNELSRIMGERVRTAVEMLIQAHGAALTAKCADIASKDIYMAGVRMIMRLVVAFFAENREGLLPKSNAIYNSAYSLSGLMQSLKRYRGNAYLLSNSFHAWPRLLALQKLIYYGSDHEALPVPPYGGELFEPGQSDSSDPVSRVIALFENEYADNPDVMSDKIVVDILGLLAETKVRIRQGRAFVLQTMPIDFSSLGNEYIGILFESLLNFELRHTPEDNPMVFLNIGDQPALPLVVLESMSDNAIKNLFKKMKKSADMEDAEEETEEIEDSENNTQEDNSAEELPEEEPQEEDTDTASAVRQRAYRWAEKACRLVGLIRQPRSNTQSAQIQYQQSVEREAKKLIFKLVEPGEWYLVRWGGTRKGSGTFYTKPQLAIPTVMRTLRPLVYSETPDKQWIPKKPEEIIAVKVCDPACGSGSFLLASLRYLTEALYTSIIVHHRLDDCTGKSIDQLIWPDLKADESISKELLPCKPEDENFECRFKTILRRYIVERCIYGVDLDPLGVELCRLSLWIETLDRELPMTFLDHKIKCGNSLVGTWFDQFMHYPLMAWTREGGDKGHKNGVHFQDSVWTNAIKGKLATVKSQLVSMIEGGDLFKQSMDFSSVMTEYQQAVQALNIIHNLNINDVGQRAEEYRKFRESPDFLRLKDAFDLWCSLWFWPGESIDLAPMPEQFALEKLSAEAKAELHKIAANNRFFHWELEFPDVFTPQKYGFDAILGNPPWDIAKPKSHEFFSSVDPLYRSYGKQIAIARQTELFNSIEIEQNWLNYCANFKFMSNWMKSCADPCGDGENGISLGRANAELHEFWRQKRKGICSAREHAFLYQGGSDINLYKMFLEQAYFLVHTSGRFGFIVPNGIYSDNGTKDLRKLFLQKCQWEWIFGYENRQKIFDIDSRFKFNPVILQKGQESRNIWAAFMRQDIGDWENADSQTVIEYPVERIRDFSKESYEIVEVQTQKDLNLLSKIYSHSVLLGDDSELSWKVKFSREFDMTNDSKLFPPREIWEKAWNYKQDEYSRWIQGDWKPIEELYKLPELAAAVQDKELCAAPPYDHLRVKRCEIPQGIILSKDGSKWLRESDIHDTVFTEANGKKISKKIDRNTIRIISGPAIAIPLYEGCMIGHFDFSYQGWISGTGNKTDWNYISWENKTIEPHYLMGAAVADAFGTTSSKLAFRDIGCATNNRTIFLAFRDIARTTDKRTIFLARLGQWPCSHTVSILTLINKSSVKCAACVLNSFVFDFILRSRMAGTHLSQFVMKPCPVIPPDKALILGKIATGLNSSNRLFADDPDIYTDLTHFAISPHERMRLRVIADSVVAALYGIDFDDLKFILKDCDHPLCDVSNKAFCRNLNPKGFWRVDKERPPEQRQTVLTLVAFYELEKLIEKNGNQDAGIKAFLALNDGEGWMLPETLRLADYGLGHDAQAQELRPVASAYGPRFYDWQLAQTPEEFRKECEIHAYNLNIGRSKVTVPDAGAVKTEPEIEQPSLF